MGANNDTDSDYDADDLPSDDEDLLDLPPAECPGKGRRLWDSSLVYPNGVQNWCHLPNIFAAFAYECPCDHKCLARVKDCHGDAAGHALCFHRQGVRAKAKELGQGGLRDHMASVYAAHYDKVNGVLTRSFVVGDVGDVCERAFAVACGLSEVTYARARRDAIADRPRHAVRVEHRQDRFGKERGELDAWVRRLRDTLEGDKNSTGSKWYMKKTTEAQLWKMFQRDCDRARQPTVGTPRLLYKVFNEHAEIHQQKPTGHDICDTCGDLDEKRAKLEGLTDAASVALRETLRQQQRAHDAFHGRERGYFNDNTLHAKLTPQETTCITIDAPTKNQFDIPAQARARRDTVKRLAGMERWQSKLEGVLDAGVGMLIFIARAALCGGSNLVCTVLMLTLAHHVAVGRPLGRRLHLQLDNTTAENKNSTVLGFVALLVQWGVFAEASIFFMPKGHTFNLLDQTFSPLILLLKQQVRYMCPRLPASPSLASVSKHTATAHSALCPPHRRASR